MSLAAAPMHPESSDGAKRLIALMTKVAYGDREAFAELYQSTSVKLFGIVFRILKRKSLAEDVLQEVYVKVWQKSADYSPLRGSPIAWMATIARNRALDEVRRVSPTLASDEVPDFETIPADGLSALDLLEMGEAYKKLSDCLASLEEDKRKMVLEAYYDGSSREALAAKFRQPVATVKTWLRRSLQSLKACLER